ncbi:hypothetical protein PG995_005353 [Apiospora arundinis]
MEAKDKDTIVKLEALLLFDDDNNNDHDGVAAAAAAAATPQPENTGLLAVHLYVRYKPSASVLFRLATSIITQIQPGSHRRDLLYLHITPDRFLSLRWILYEQNAKEDKKKTHPPCLDAVRQEMGISGDVLRLQFTLDRPGDLVVPNDLDLNKHNSEASSARPILSLATASDFSLYIQPNALPQAVFAVLDGAIRQWPRATQNQKNKLGQMVDRRSLYGGKGGKLYCPSNPNPNPVQPKAPTDGLPLHDDNASPPPYANNKEPGGSRSPPGASEEESDIATVATDTPPRYYASLLHHDPDHGRGEKVGERRKVVQQQPSPAAAHRSDATTASADSSLAGDSCMPPGYPGYQGFGRVSPTHVSGIARKRRKRNLSDLDAADLDPCAKGRPRQSGQDDKAAWGSGLKAGLDMVQALVARVEQQQWQIRQLLQENREWAERYHDLDERLAAVEEKQDEAREERELLSAEVGEVRSECADLGRRLPDVGEEIQEWLVENMEDEVRRREEERDAMMTTTITTENDETTKAAMEKWLAEGQEGEGASQLMYQSIVDRVTAEVKDKIRSALEN